MTTAFARRYGPWVLVAAASEGIGAAFATALAARGLDLVLVARRPEPLDALAGTLPTRTRTATLGRKIPGARFVELAGAGHLLPVERPTEVAAALRDLLKA
jgi:NAD(P)-dependent dehydrogenase (short-subunit alcohol dehydrogenase family)